MVPATSVSPSVKEPIQFNTFLDQFFHLFLNSAVGQCNKVTQVRIVYQLCGSNEFKIVIFGLLHCDTGHKAFWQIYKAQGLLSEFYGIWYRHVRVSDWVNVHKQTGPQCVHKSRT